MSKISDLHSLFSAIETEDEVVVAASECRRWGSIKDRRGRERKEEREGREGEKDGRLLL